MSKVPYPLVAYELTEARREGATVREIAEVVGYSRSWVSVLLRWYANGYGSSSSEPSRNGFTRACATCGEQFTWTRADTRYCSGACRQRAYRQRKASAS